jgi:hypothetical protein
MVTLMVSQPTSTTVPAQGAADDSQHSARRWWALIAIAASVLVVGLDLTVLNLALPNIAVSRTPRPATCSGSPTRTAW